MALNMSVGSEHNGRKEALLDNRL